MNVSTEWHLKWGLIMLKYRQRINVNGYVRSIPPRSSDEQSVEDIRRISIIPKTIELSDDAVDYMDRCITILQGRIYSDLIWRDESWSFILETQSPLRFLK